MSEEKPVEFWKAAAEGYCVRAEQAEATVEALRSRINHDTIVLRQASNTLYHCEAWVRPKRTWLKIFKTFSDALNKYACGNATNDTMRVFWFGGERMIERMEPAELNRRLAGLLGVELGARTEEDFETVSVHFWRNCDESMVRLIIGFPEPLEELFRRREGRVWQDAIEAFAETWERDLVDYAGDLQTAFGLSSAMKERKLEREFARELMRICHVMDLDSTFFQVAHASAYDRALAAFRAMGGEE